MSQSAAWDNFNVSTRGEQVMFSENHETEPDEFKGRNYIPSRNRAKYLRYFYIASSILVTLIVIILIIMKFTGNDEKNEIAFSTASNINASKMSTDSYGYLVITINKTKCMKYHPKTKTLDLIFEAPITSAITAFDIRDDKCIYWTEAKASRVNYQCNEDLKVVLLEEKRFAPEGLALDRVTENIYVVDETAGTLIVMNRYSRNYAILLTDFINACDVMLDSEEGFVFILQHSHSILRANMDGSEPKEIIRSKKITSLTIDTKRKRLYWINDTDNIKSSDYNGTIQQFVFNDTVRITGIAVLDDDLFWTRPSHEKSTSILSCKINADGSCEDHKTHEINAIGNVKSIRGYSTFTPSISNPCKENNCTQLCLLINKNKSRCACRMGWQLDPDGRSCHEVRDFVVYPYGDYVRTCSLDGKQEIFWPTRYSIDSQRGKKEIDFDYEFKNDYFYFTDGYHIYRMKLKAYAEQEIILSVDSSDIRIEKIAYDWLTGHMYHVQLSEPAAPFLYSFIISKTQAYRETLRMGTFNYSTMYSFGLVLHPIKRYIFATLTDDSDGYSWLYREWMNGSIFEQTEHFYTENEEDHRLFNIDFSNNQLYSISCSRMTSKLWISDIHNTSFEEAGFVNVAYPKSFSFHQKWLYISNSTSIYRVNKELRNDLSKIAPRVEMEGKSIVGVKIISEEMHFTDADNPCHDDNNDNGGCEQFCYVGPNASKAICGCKDGQEVNEDGRCQEVD